MDDTLTPAEKKFWQEFDAAAAAAAAPGKPSAGEISRIASETIQHDVAESTIRGWLTHKSLPRYGEDFITVIKVFQAEQQLDWESLLRVARKARDARSCGESDPQPSEDPPESLTGATRWRRVVGVGVVIAVLAVVVAVVFSVLETGSPEQAAPSPTMSSQSPEQVCVEVISPVARVFPEPGANPYSRIAKYRGDQIILYPEMSDITGPDGLRYRAIRSPARANPGKSPYSWMLADDIADAPCVPPLGR